MRRFDYYKPLGFEQAFKLLTRPGKVAYPLAGATDLIPMIRDELLKPDVVVDIKELPGMRDIIETEEGVAIGAGLAVAVRVTAGAGERVDVGAGSEVATVVELGVWVGDAVQEQMQDTNANMKKNKEEQVDFSSIVGRIMAAMGSGIMR